MQRLFDDTGYLRIPLLLTLSLALPIASACSDDGEEDEEDTCDEVGQLPQGYRPIASVSTGQLTMTGDGDVATAIIDATAGGFGMSADNPFIYIDLEAGEKVEIDDVEALDSDDWDLALKRPTIRVNGGDSGTGGVEVAVVAADALEDVTQAPPDGDFGVDDWVDEACAFIPERDGSPASAFGEWYDYDQANNILTPRAEVHVIRTRSGDLVRFEIETYYGDESQPMRGAVYDVRWAPL